MQNQSYLQKLSSIIPEDKTLKKIANNCCCAMVALWIMGIMDVMSQLEVIVEEIRNGSLSDDCLVYWIPFFKNVTGRDIFVEFRNIKSLDDLKDVKTPCAVKFKKDKNSHWVGVENCRVVYNSLDRSECVDKGKPVEARIIKFK